MRTRACAAIIKDGRILMVHHKSSTNSYWTLPGGGLDDDETPEQAVVREVKEETGLDVIVGHMLFSEDYEFGLSYCYFVTLVENNIPLLGHDPEDSHLPEEERLLQAVAWRDLKDMQNDVQVSKVFNILGIEL